MVYNSQFDVSISRPLCAENTAICISVFKDISDYFAQAVGKRTVDFHLAALCEEFCKSLTFLMNYVTKRLSCFATPPVKFYSGERSYRQPSDPAGDAPWRVSSRNANPFEKANMREVFMCGISSVNAGSVYPLEISRTK